MGFIYRVYRVHPSARRPPFPDLDLFLGLPEKSDLPIPLKSGIIP